MNQTNHKVQCECIARLLQAFLRERLLPLIKENDKYAIPLPQHSASLQLEQVKISSLAHIKVQGPVIYLKNSTTMPKLIQNSLELLDLIEPELKAQLNPQQWKHFVIEIENHIANSTLSYKNTEKFNAILAKSMAKMNHHNFYQWITETNSYDNKSLFFEQWTSQGHPYHPCSKTKLGLSLQEVIQYSPEFHQQTDIYIAAIHRSIVHIETMETDSFYVDWFFEYFPKIKEPWTLQLKLNKLDLDSYIPLPIHPWQATHKIRTCFKSLIDSSHLYIFDNVTLPTNPTLSFRTVAPTENLYQPHIKLPVAVQTTSTIRTVSPASTENGPRISKFLKMILQKENNFHGYLRFTSEFFGLHVKGYDDKETKHLSAIFRDNVNNHLNNDEIGIVVAALFEQTPINKKPLCIEIMEFSGVKNINDIKMYFERYVNIMLSSYLDLYLLYGLALEAHQQNTIAVFCDGEPVCTIARDFGGLRLHLSSFREKGFNLTPYPNSATLREERDEVRNKLLHTTYQYHLGEWVLHLAKYSNTLESEFWAIIKKITQQRFDMLQARIDPILLQQERQAILENDWPLKALLRMRLDNVSHDYIYMPINNPLKQ